VLQFAVSLYESLLDQKSPNSRHCAEWRLSHFTFIVTVIPRR